MAARIKAKHGLIDVANGIIAAIVGSAAAANYGVVGMASESVIRDEVNEILNRVSYKRDVAVKSVDNRITVDIYVIVGYGFRISEVSRNVRDSVKYNLEQQLGIQAKSINVTIQDIEVLDE